MVKRAVGLQREPHQGGRECCQPDPAECRPPSSYRRFHCAIGLHVTPLSSAQHAPGFCRPAGISDGERQNPPTSPSLMQAKRSDKFSRYSTLIASDASLRCAHNQLWTNSRIRFRAYSTRCPNTRERSQGTTRSSHLRGKPLKS